MSLRLEVFGDFLQISFFVNFLEFHFRLQLFISDLRFVFLNEFIELYSEIFVNAFLNIEQVLHQVEKDHGEIIIVDSSYLVFGVNHENQVAFVDLLKSNVEIYRHVGEIENWLSLLGPSGSVHFLRFLLFGKYAQSLVFSLREQQMRSLERERNKLAHQAEFQGPGGLSEVNHETLQFQFLINGFVFS